jgi:hypothetical protein
MKLLRIVKLIANFLNADCTQIYSQFKNYFLNADTRRLHADIRRFKDLSARISRWICEICVKIEIIILLVIKSAYFLLFLQKINNND